MLPGDEVLLSCNETELLQLARKQGYRSLRRGLPTELLVAIVTGEVEPSEDSLAKITATRERLSAFIGNPKVHKDSPNWGVIRSQLPGCDGVCTEYPCSDGRHAACYAPNKRNV